MNHNGHLCVWMATTARSNPCRPLRALTSERNSCCFAGRCSLYLARKQRSRFVRVAWRTPPPSSVCVGGGRVARLFCQRGGALEGLVGPCEAGARTAAPAQEAGSSTAQREKRQETVCISVLDSDVWAFLPPYMCDSSFERLVVPGAEFPGILPKSKQSEAYSAGLLPAGPKTNPASQGVISRPLRRAERRIGQRRQQALHR